MDSRSLTASDTVDITVKFVGFEDDFSTDTTSTYAPTPTSGLGGTFTWDSIGKREFLAYALGLTGGLCPIRKHCSGLLTPSTPVPVEVEVQDRIGAVRGFPPPPSTRRWRDDLLSLTIARYCRNGKGEVCGPALREQITDE